MTFRGFRISENFETLVAGQVLLHLGAERGVEGLGLHFCLGGLRFSFCAVLEKSSGFYRNLDVFGSLRAFPDDIGGFW